MPFHHDLGRPATTDTDRRALIDIEAVQRRDPGALGRGDRPDGAARERLTTVLAAITPTLRRPIARDHRAAELTR